MLPQQLRVPRTPVRHALAFLTASHQVEVAGQALLLGVPSRPGARRRSSSSFVWQSARPPGSWRVSGRPSGRPTADLAAEDADALVVEDASFAVATFAPAASPAPVRSVASPGGLVARQVAGRLAGAATPPPPSPSVTVPSWCCVGRSGSATASVRSWASSRLRPPARSAGRDGRSRPTAAPPIGRGRRRGAPSPAAPRAALRQGQARPRPACTGPHAGRRGLAVAHLPLTCSSLFFTSAGSPCGRRCWGHRAVRGNQPAWGT